MYNSGIYDYGSYSQSLSMLDTIMAYIGIIMTVTLIISIISIISMWKIFSTNGEKGWKSIIPIYNTYTLLKVVNLPGWYLLLYIVPIVNIFALYKTCDGLAKLYGKSTIFAVLCMFFPFVCYPILAFGGKTVEKTTLQEPVVPQNEPIQPVYENVLEPTEANVIVGETETLVSTEVDRTLQSTTSSLITSQNVSLNTDPVVVQSVEPTFEQQQAGETNVAVSTQAPKTSSVVIPTGPATDRVCPNCGSKVGQDAKVCFMCGTRI